MPFDVARQKRATQVLVLIAVALAAGIIAAGVLLYASQARAFRSEMEQQLAAIADLKVGEISLWRRERLADASVFYKNPAFTDVVRRYLAQPADTKARAELQTWMSRIHADYNYDRVFLVDVHGRERISRPDTEEPLSSIVRRAVLEAMRSGRITFVDFYRSEYSHNVYLAVLIPILDERAGGRPIGVLVLRIDPSLYLYPFINRWPVPSKTAETLIVRREGNEVVYLNELRFKKNTALVLRMSMKSKDLPAVMAAQGRVGTVEGIDYRGVRVLAAIRRIPDSPWFLVARMDAAEVYAPLRERLWTTIILVGALLIGAAAGVGFIWRRQSADFYRDMYEAEQERQRFARRFESLTRYANDMILLSDRDGRILDANERALAAYGYTLEEMLRLNLTDLYAPEERGMVESHLHEAEEEGSQVLESVHQRKDGSTLSVQISCRMIDVEGERLHQSVVRDITQRKELEREQSIRNEIASIIIAVPDVDMYGEVLDVVLRTMESRFGVFAYMDEDGELIAPSMTRDVWDQCNVPDKTIRFPPETWGDNIWARAIRQKKSLRKNEPGRVPEGHVPIENVLVVPILYRDEVIGHFEVANKEGGYTEADQAWLEGIARFMSPVLNARLERDRRDAGLKRMTEDLRESEADLKRSNDELQQFAYIASHDLQEPLRMISSYLQLLERRYKGSMDKDADEFINYAVDGAKRLQDMINGLLEVSRVGSRGKPFVPVDCEEALQTALTNLEVAIGESGAEITHDPLPTVSADPSQMVQLLQNLIANAIKFRSEEAPRIHVSAKKEGGDWTFAVRDNGLGIDSQYHDRLFVIFQRLHGREEYPGVGIGLATCKRIVERHGGRIWFESEPGKGSTFYFTIPTR